MKILFIEARRNTRAEAGLAGLRGLPKEIHILYTIQYKALAEKIKNLLSKEHKILGFEQVLGCSKINPKASLLLIGSGEFHALQLAMQSKKEIYIYTYGKISKISQQEIEKLAQKEKAKLSKFFSAEKIAVLVSIKEGQNKLGEARKFVERLEEKFKEKKFYFLVSDTISSQELENFNFGIGINFACPGLGIDNKILNYSLLEPRL